MPTIFLVYLVIYGLLVLMNGLYWLVMGQRLVLVIYAFTAGLYLSFLSAAYWNPNLTGHMGLYNIPIMLIILGVDFHSAMKWRKIDIKMIFPNMDDEAANLIRRLSVIEIAKSVPLLIAAPLYIVGFMMIFELVKAKFHAG